MSSFYGNASIGSGLPEVNNNDNGKVLIAKDGEWELGFPSADGLPNVTTNDDGKTLVVENGEWVVDNVDLGYSVEETMVADYDIDFTSGVRNQAAAGGTRISTNPLIISLDDGEIYEIPFVSLSNGDGSYGTEGDYSTYPVYIKTDYGGGITITTADGGDHNLKILSQTDTIVTTQDFDAAVNNASNLKNIIDGSGIASFKSIAALNDNDYYTIGDYAFAEGNQTCAKGTSSHAEGFSTLTSADYAHAEGEDTHGGGIASHGEGSNTCALGDYSHAEGYDTVAGKRSQHVFGEMNLPDPTFNYIDQSTWVTRGTYVEIVGNGSENQQSNARTLDWNGNEVLAGKLTVGVAPTNNMDVATKQYVDTAVSNAGGGGGLQNLVDGSATGSVRGVNTAAENANYTIGQNAFAEGSNTKASGDYSHAEGVTTIASGMASHAEGSGIEAKGKFSHAEGSLTVANGVASHSEGESTFATADRSHAEGAGSNARGIQSHAEGFYTMANHRSQHVFGEYNIADGSSALSTQRGTYVEIVGNGTNDARSNARTLDWNGNEVLAGKLTVGAGPVNAMDVATKQYVDNNSGGGNSLTQAQKKAIMQCFSSVAWAVGNGSNYLKILGKVLNTEDIALTSLKILDSLNGSIISEIYAKPGQNVETLNSRIIVIGVYADGSECPMLDREYGFADEEGNEMTVLPDAAGSYTITIRELDSPVSTAVSTNLTVNVVRDE